MAISTKRRSQPAVVPYVVEVTVIPPYSLELSFVDGVRKRIDLESELYGEVFEPLRNPDYFAQASIDPVAGTVVWPNGADLAPEFLYSAGEQLGATRGATRRSDALAAKAKSAVPARGSDEQSKVFRNYMRHLERLMRERFELTSIAGHAQHRGFPREAFVREFLADHLSEAVGVGTGEVFDANSAPGKGRRQHDIVIYLKNYPRVHLGDGIDAFFAESVVATIEVKSELRLDRSKPEEDHLRQALTAARELKNLKREPQLRRLLRNWYYPPGPLSYLFAYGKCQIDTVVKHLSALHSELGIEEPPLPIGGRPWSRNQIQSLDGIFVLDRGFLHFHNFPFSTEGEGNWILADTSSEECSGEILLTLFWILTKAVAAATGSPVRAGAYGLTTRWQLTSLPAGAWATKAKQGR